MKQAVERDYPVPEKLRPSNMTLPDAKTAPSKKSGGMFGKITAVAAAAALITVGAVTAFDLRDKAVQKAEEKKEQEYSVEISKNEPSSVMQVYSKNSYKKIYDNLMEQKEKMENNIYFTEDMVVDEIATNDAEMDSAGSVPEAPTATKGDVQSGSSNSDDYYKTYLQTEGIDEADSIKTDGKFIYYTSGDCVYVVDPNDGDPEVSAKVSLESYYSYYTAPQLYLADGNLVVVYPADNKSSTYARVYSISDKGELESLTSYTQAGSYCDSRMKDGVLYLITESYVDLYNIKKGDLDTYIPTYELNNDTCLVQPEDIYISQNCHGNIYTNIASFDITKNKPDVSIKSTLGNTATIYCSYDNLYLMRTFYTSYANTEITKISLNGGDLKLACASNLMGYVNDQFSADEYDGYFRIAVTRSDDNAVYVLDENLTTVGMVDGMGFDETIKSVSFSGNTCYVVTFRQTDPLYTIDLSDPKNPTVTDALKVSGFSTHLRSFGDDLLLGFGQEADENTGITSGIKLSMFRQNADGKNEEIAKEVIGNGFGYTYSEAIRDHKYLMILPDKNLIGFPYYSESWAYYDEISDSTVEFDTGYFYAVYRYENERFEELAKISLGYYSKTDTRAVYIGSVIYIFSEQEVISVDMNTGEVISRKSLNG